MQELIYQHSIHSCLNYNIEAIRDAVDIIGLHEMANCYQHMAWGITEGGRLTIMITDRRPVENNFRAVIVEFQGDGCCTICKCDSYGKPIDENDYRLFDTHWYIGKSSNLAFRNILKTYYGIIY